LKWSQPHHRLQRQCSSLYQPPCRTIYLCPLTCGITHVISSAPRGIAPRGGGGAVWYVPRCSLTQSSAHLSEPLALQRTIVDCLDRRKARNGSIELNSNSWIGVDSW
jgi:hypothetical protein